MWRVSSQSTTSASRSSSSTRSVTSRRFPIGVAQTASGTSAPSRASRTRRARRRSRRPRARARRSRAAPLPGRGERVTPHHLARGPEEKPAGRDAEAPAENDDVGIEEVDEGGDRGAQVTADPLERRMPLLDEVAGSPHPARAARAPGGRRRAPSSTTRRALGRYRPPGTARRPRRSPCAPPPPSPR